MFDTMDAMGSYVDQAIEFAEKANAELQADLLCAEDRRELQSSYAKLQKLAAYGLMALAQPNADPAELARITGTSIGKARETAATAKVMAESGALSEALKHGEVSLEQAAEIAKAEEAAPGAAEELVVVAKKEPFHAFKEKARAVKLEGEQHNGLAPRQHAARCARSYADDLGMINIPLRLEPHVGARIVARAEAEAQRLARAAKKTGTTEPFERYLADAYAKLLSGSGKGRATRPELVVLVSHEVAKRGWTEVRKGEVCKIPGVGPVSPQVAKEIAQDAFLTGVFYDGTDLRHLKRWSKHIPPEIRVALELGEPPEFDGVKCVDCGNRFRPEIDHVEPRASLGPTSNGNLKPRCWSCHQEKTKLDRKAGKLKPRGPDP